MVVSTFFRKENNLGYSLGKRMALSCLEASGERGLFSKNRLWFLIHHSVDWGGRIWSTDCEKLAACAARPSLLYQITTTKDLFLLFIVFATTWLMPWLPVSLFYCLYYCKSVYRNDRHACVLLGPRVEFILWCQRCIGQSVVFVLPLAVGTSAVHFSSV